MSGRVCRVVTCLVFLLLALSIPGTALAQAIIADHRAADDFDKIPEYWLEQAKQLTIHYAHTSHGGQINSGLSWLEGQDPKYSFARKGYDPGLPPQENPPALRMYDGNGPCICDGGVTDPCMCGSTEVCLWGGSYVQPIDYWSTECGRNRTRAVADTGLFDFSMWAWCGQMSGSDPGLQTYLETLNTFESEYPGMRFIYMTGHTDGGSTNLTNNNQALRDYVVANNKVLFDFADIESYDPDGNYYPNARDMCDWCVNWCWNHPEEAGCTNPPSYCAHSRTDTEPERAFNCVRKAKAFWWLMARLAGWNGQTEDDTVAPAAPSDLRTASN